MWAPSKSEDSKKETQNSKDNGVRDLAQDQLKKPRLEGQMPNVLKLDNLQSSNFGNTRVKQKPPV
jgi:hypothetical protein